MFNSKDDKLIDTVKKTPEYVCYSEQGILDDITIADALHHIVHGEPFVDSNEHIYGYALICICGSVGQKGPYAQEIKLGYETDLIGRYLKQDFGLDVEIENELFLNDLDMLPPVNDFPGSGIMTQGDLQSLSDLLADIDVSEDSIDELLDGEDEDKGCAYEHIMGLKMNLKYCLDNNFDLVSFCH